jgi:hypothetical protein
VGGAPDPYDEIERLRTALSEAHEMAQGRLT